MRPYFWSLNTVQFSNIFHTITSITNHIVALTIPFAGLFPPNEIQFPLAENQFPLNEIQFPITESQFPLNEIQFPFNEIQFPLTENQFSRTEIQFPLTENQFPLNY